MFLILTKGLRCPISSSEPRTFPYFPTNSSAMKYMDSLGPFSLRTGLLVHFSFNIVLSLVTLSLIYTLDIIGDPQDEDQKLREAVLIVRYIVTTYFGVNLVSNSILLVGIVMKWTRLLLPYFMVCPVMALLAFSGGIYCMIAPGQGSLILTGIMFGSMDALFLFASFSYYKLLKANERDSEHYCATVDGSGNKNNC